MRRFKVPAKVIPRSGKTYSQTLNKFSKKQKGGNDPEPGLIPEDESSRWNRLRRIRMMEKVGFKTRVELSR